MKNDKTETRLESDIDVFDTVKLSDEKKSAIAEKAKSKAASDVFVKRKTFAVIASAVACFILVVTLVLSFAITPFDNNATTDGEASFDTELYTKTNDTEKETAENGISDTVTKESSDLKETTESEMSAIEIVPNISDYDYKTGDAKIYEKKADVTGERIITEHEDGTEDYKEYAENIQYSSHVLTATEINDTVSYDDFIKYRDNLTDMTNFGINIKDLDRVTVTVTADSDYVCGAKIIALSNGQDVAYAITDVHGKAYLFRNVLNDGFDTITVNGTSYPVADDAKELTVNIESSQKDTPSLDLMIISDATGSMGDELEYIKAEITDIVDRIINETQIEAPRVSLNVYRDYDDIYTVRRNDFTDASGALDFLKAQSANGGGDYPEIPDLALCECISESTWQNSVRLCIIILDAPPHEGDATAENLKKAISTAQKLGVRIIPVLASGSDEQTELIMRTLAVLTGGTTSFLTDDSGIGGSHTAPTTDKQLTVEYFDDQLVRIITSYLRGEN